MTYYLLTDRNGTYIRKDISSGKYVTIKSQACAERFESMVKAKRVLESHVPHKIRKGFTIEVIHEGEAGSPEKDITKADRIADTKEINDIYVPNFDYTMDALEEDLDRIISYIKNSRKRNSELSVCMSQVDSKINDMAHAIEFGTYNACQGWKQFASLQSTYRIRRKIKDGMTLTKCATEMPSSVLESLEMMKSTIETMKSRKYTTRVKGDIVLVEA